MMGFLSKWFKKREPELRQIHSLKQLQLGDMITLDDSFGLPPPLRSQTLVLEHVYCDEYQHTIDAIYWFKNQQGHAFRLVEHKDHLLLWLSLTRAQVEQVFAMDDFSEIFEPQGAMPLTPQSLSNLPQLTPWIGQQYHRISFAEFGYLHHQDYRQQRPPQSDDHQGGQPFERYFLESSDEQHALLVQVMSSGETEVYLGIVRPQTDIQEFWPRGNP
ncbi:hypothetical protein [Shewanella sp. NIFS-20-20]|uniref:hypothetical protein n=1 Tax=Shewanella sp. NIFS-20-20 TaxID=2853806 RepID=UPI001C47BD6F|nr:hypothetical protein [Shewanella sp. NIFS-20-20]MBV7314690.1 hypothetical protein [Shewanella sp. NIFS-20-20]